jgi:thiamine pyrophosphokinase
VHGPADGVRTRGLRWPLVGERLHPGGSRGISNELLDDVADVSIDGGCVAVVQPDEEHP